MFNEQELAILTNALDQALASTKRAQNTSKMPQLKEIYRLAQQDIEQLKHKLHTLPVDTKRKV